MELGPLISQMNEKARKVRAVLVFAELCGLLRIPQLQIYIQEG
jgi:hypothetical protein